MIVLGLTGGIGCGKSTVAGLLGARGVARVDADQIARDVVAPGTPGLDEIVRAFGRGVLAPDGALDRKKLAAEVFSSDARRNELNAMLHPRIAAESTARLVALAETGRALALYEAALLVENGVHRGMSGLIVVTARADVQRERTIARDRVTASEANARIRAQAPLASKVAAATWVVDNSESLERLVARVAALYAELAVTYGPLPCAQSTPRAGGTGR